jgi:hypothetical protein
LDTEGLARKPDNLEVSMATPEIKRAFRGVDAGQVDDVIRSISQALSATELALAERARTISRLKREIADPSSAAPSFSKLGSTFEETLRVAEQHARRLRSEAAAESAAIANKTDIEVRNLADKTERMTRDIVVSAQADANEIRLQVEREKTAANQLNDDERARMETVASRAERSAASMISQAEQQISDARASAYSEMMEIKRRAAELIRTASDTKVETEKRIGVDVADAQASSTAMHDEADAYAQQAYESADAHLESAIAEASSTKQRADDYLASAQIRADEILQDSRSLVEKSISEAILRSEEIARSSEEFFADFTYDAELSISQIRRNSLALNDYAVHMRDVSQEVNVDAIEAGATTGMRSIQQAEIVKGDK